MKRLQTQMMTTKEEMSILSEQLGEEDLYILGFLKGFDRKIMKEWIEKGYWDYKPDY
jgi:hypothetical protein